MRILREINVYTLELLAQEIHHPVSSIAIMIPPEERSASNPRPLDFGAFSYAEREYVHRAKAIGDTKGQSIKVNPNSFLPHRVKLLESLYEYFITQGILNSTIKGYYGKMQNAFKVVECLKLEDEFLLDIEATRNSYAQCVFHLQNQVRNGSMKPRNAQAKQDALNALIRITFGESEYHYLRTTFPGVKGTVESTEPRKKDEIRLAFETYKSFALEVSKFLMEGKPFPHKIKMPNYETFLFPYRAHYWTPYLKTNTKMYHPEEGRLVTLDEYAKKEPRRHRGYLNHNLKNAAKNLNDANDDTRCKSRRSLASYALQSFTMVFMIATGAYQDEIAQIESTDNIDVKKSVSHKSYKIIKMRAKGKEIRYTIASNMIYIIRKFLEFRSWVLNGSEFPKLFFSLQPRSWSPDLLTDNRLGAFQSNSMIGKYLPHDYKILSAREIRTSKNIWIHTETDTPSSTSSMMLGHSFRTNLNSYSNVTPEKMQQEFSDFWASAAEAARHVKRVGKKKKTQEIPVASGHCEDFKHPVASIDAPPIAPNCRSQFGCLFCEHYICHADEYEDIHKVMSLLYIVDGVMNGSKEIEKSFSKFSLLAGRIRQILHQVQSKSDTGKNYVEKARKQVYQLEELTPYWESRLQRYEKLGIHFGA